MEALLPPGLDPTSAAILVAASVATSALTAAFGVGGGVTLLALMASLVPAPALIPVHGLVQLGSNAGRAGLMARAVRPGVAAPFAIGTGLGALAGGSVAVALPPAVLTLAIGLFVLATLRGPKARLPTIGLGPLRMPAAGLVTGWLTMFLGATGPLIAAVLRPVLTERAALVATLAVLMTLQHLLKIVAFGLFGFAFGPWLGLAAAMVASGFLGTLIGARVLARLDEGLFRRALDVLLTLLSLRLIGLALLDLVG